MTEQRIESVTGFEDASGVVVATTGGLVGIATYETSEDGRGAEAETATLTPAQTRKLAGILLRAAAEADGHPVEDALASFAVWEGQPLGLDFERSAPGFTGYIKPPRLYAHIAGAHGASSAMGRTAVPAVYLKLAAGIVGTGPRYHIIDTIIGAEVAEELAGILALCATKARDDVAAGPGFIGLELDEEDPTE